MRIFQTCFFIVEVILYLILGLAFALFPEKLFSNNKYTSNEWPSYSYLELTSTRKRARRQIKPWKIVWFIIVMSITVYLIKPYILDVPQLITGKLNYVTGEVQDIRTVSKDPTEYVYICGGYEVEFFFSSGVSKYKDYKIGYLTHTKRAIYCEQIDESNGYRKAVGFPFKDILVFLTVIGGIIFIAVISQYVRFKLFIPVNIISFLVFTYYFIKFGIDYGIWFSADNKGLVGLIMGLVGLFITLFSYFIERLRYRDNLVTFFCAQLISVGDIGLLICLIFNLN
ncbi:MAG: hypothetical protein Q8936_06160 [Bacillota bacterium]|nr:hypothetical protein [Bacillota bacterium]